MIGPPVKITTIAREHCSPSSVVVSGAHFQSRTSGVDGNSTAWKPGYTSIRIVVCTVTRFLLVTPCCHWTNAVTGCSWLVKCVEIKNTLCALLVTRSRGPPSGNRDRLTRYSPLIKFSYLFVASSIDRPDRSSKCHRPP